MCYHAAILIEGNMLLEFLVILQYSVTATSGAFNASYFARYRTLHRGRQVAARVLAVASLALVLESLYFGVYLFVRKPDTDARIWLLAGFLSTLGSLLMSALILRQIFHHRS